MLGALRTQFWERKDNIVIDDRDQGILRQIRKEWSVIAWDIKELKLANSG
jgi:hypothetical protein